MLKMNGTNPKNIQSFFISPDFLEDGGIILKPNQNITLKNVLVFEPQTFSNESFKMNLYVVSEKTPIQ